MFATVTLELLKGFVETLKIFLLTVGFSVPLGVVICMGSMHRFTPLRVLVRGLVWVIRGTPLMLQLILIFYGPSLLFEVQGFDRFTAVIVAFSLNYACYFSEIYRGGYSSIPVGQFEAGRVLGMSKTQIFFRVILVQVVKNVLAPMGNEFITLVKDTALSRTIAIYEVTYMGQSFIKKGLLWPLLFTGVFYLLFSGVLTVLFSKLEKKLSYIRS
ncbi:MAG: amino acid ABC transporter permease [Oscillospiraceae bacterium]|nr:amino acid ABC transporter permease [Oscillospiraceae bacterium]